MHQKSVYSDATLVTSIGVTAGICALVPLTSVGFTFTLLSSLGIILGVTAIIVLGFLFALYLGHWSPIFPQITKFGIVGGLNTLFELTIINIFISAAGGVTLFPLFKAFSFLLAVSNAYIFNKRWTFLSSTRVTQKELTAFFIVNGLALGANVGVATFLVNVVGAPRGIPEAVWVNVSVVIAVLVAMIWNFMGQKHVIFREC
jgi:putative flippase GtrA